MTSHPLHQPSQSRLINYISALLHWFYRALPDRGETSNRLLPEHDALRLCPHTDRPEKHSTGHEYPLHAPRSSSLNIFRTTNSTFIGRCQSATTTTRDARRKPSPMPCIVVSQYPHHFTPEEFIFPSAAHRTKSGMGIPEPHYESCPVAARMSNAYQVPAARPEGRGSKMAYRSVSRVHQRFRGKA